MTLFLVGNYAPDRQQSMLRFGAMLERGLAGRGTAVQLLQPQPWATRLWPNYRYGGAAKWLGYWDKFVRFPRFLRRLQARAPQSAVFHLLDHSNAPWLSALPNARALVTCHDLLAIRAARGEFPHHRPGWSGRRQQEWIARYLSTARHVACVSENTRADFERFAPCGSTTTLTVVPNGLHQGQSPPAPAVARAAADRLTAPLGWPPATPYLLVVGNNSWYKNRPGAVRLHAALGRHGIDTHLLAVGAPWRDAERRLATDLGIAARLGNAGAVSDADLASLYTAAEGLLFPSWEEGFGWPVAEAMACGCPVFASDRAPMTEVGAGAAVFFPPEDVETAASVIAANWPDRDTMRARGRREAVRFAPERMVDRYLDLYTQIGAQPPGSAR
jgi:glycosyltransferase involved in cell wall biosynthesis